MREREREEREKGREGGGTKGWREGEKKERCAVDFWFSIFTGLILFGY
jgi:hypothetical protein